jgi:hypothetical protein
MRGDRPWGGIAYPHSMFLKYSPLLTMDYRYRARPGKPSSVAGLCRAQRQIRRFDVQVSRRTIGNLAPILVSVADRASSNWRSHWRALRASVTSAGVSDRRAQASKRGAKTSVSRVTGGGRLRVCLIRVGAARRFGAALSRLLGAFIDETATSERMETLQLWVRANEGPEERRFFRNPSADPLLNWCAGFNRFGGFPKKQAFSAFAPQLSPIAGAEFALRRR